jgi:hypothetical protein
MGDRANFVFEQHNGDRIFLYGHNAGHNMLANLATAIEAARPRWSDEVYATRIAISQMLGDHWKSPYAELGWGISTYLTDNEHSIPVVNWTKGTVTLYDESLVSQKFSMSLDVFVTKFSKTLVEV